MSAPRPLQMALAAWLFLFLSLLDMTQARERHRLIVPQPIKTVHRTHQTQYARAYGYESQLKHLKAIAPLAQGIKSRAGPTFPGTQSNRPRPLRSQNTKNVPVRGQASSLRPTRGDPLLYKRPGPAPGLKRIPTRNHMLPAPKPSQYKNINSVEQYAANFQEQPSKFQKHLYEENENGGATSYQNHVGNIHHPKYPKYRHNSNRIPYVDETNEDEAVDDYDEPETHRLSASQIRGAYRKPPGAHLKEPSRGGYEVQEGHHRHSVSQKENLYSAPQQLRHPADDGRHGSERPSSSASSSSSLSSGNSPSVEDAYKTAYQAFSYKKIRNNPDTTQNYQSQAQRGEYSGVNSYGQPVQFGEQRNTNNYNNNNNKENKDGDHDIGFGEGLV